MEKEMEKEKEKKDELKARMISELSVDTLNMLIDFELSRAGQEDFDDQRLEDDYTNLIGEIVHEKIHGIIDDEILKKVLEDAGIVNQ